MISLTAEPEKILEGENLIIKLDIVGKVNKQTYFGKYFKLNIRKNGSEEVEQLYPLRYNLEPLIWEINSNIYGAYGVFYGTYNVTASLQNLQKIIANTNFIVEEQCLIKKTNVCNNITWYENENKIKTMYSNNNKKEDNQMYIPNIQKPGEVYKNKINNIDNKILENINDQYKTYSNVQIATKNVNSI